MGDWHVWLIVALIMIGFVLFLLVWARSLDRTLYGREISKKMSKRNFAMIGFVILFVLGMGSFEDQFGKGYHPLLLLTFLGLAWLEWFVTMYRRTQESENYIYEIPCSKQIPTWLIVLMAFGGSVVMSIGWLTNFRSNVILFIGFVLIFGALLLVNEKTNQVFFTATKIYNRLDRFEWDRIIWWSWTEEKDNERKVVVQLNGFWSSIDFRTIKIPVDRYEDVDQLFREFTKNLKPENIEPTL